LWHFPDTGAIILHIDNKNGLERWNNDDFFWMGTEATILHIFSATSGVLDLQATFSPGPSLTASDERHLVVKSNEDYQKSLTVRSEQAITWLPVQKGMNMISLQVLDQPDAVQPPNGDKRLLLLAVHRLTAHLSDSMVAIKQIKNPYGIEKTSKPMFWMGEEPTEIVVAAAQAGRLTLQGQFVMGPSIPDQAQRQLLVESDQGYHQVLKITPDTHSVTLPVPSGQTTIKLTPLDRPVLDVLPNGDPRKLILGVVDLSAILDT
jgi:hypothetical protein